MKNNNIIIGAGIVILIAGAYFLGTKSDDIKIDSLSGVVSTTTDSISSSTSVTTGTNVKPVTKPSTTTSTSNNYIKIGQRVLLKGLYITPSKVTYDSRCPKDVQCIQAGTVELGVLLENGSLSQNAIITLGKPFYFAEREVTLTAVTPSKLSTQVLKDTDYRFIITVK